MTKNIYRKVFVVLCSCLPLYVLAGNRPDSLKREAALEVLCKNPNKAFRTFAAKAKDLTRLDVDSFVTIMGFRSGGYAIISNDDRFPAVLAYSDSQYDEDAFVENSGLKWWRNSIKSVLRSNKGKNIEKLIEPGENVDKNVAPLLTCTWAQDNPFYKFCPVDNGQNTLVGCVATAMAQIMYYNRYPEKGQGKRTIYYPYNDKSGTPYTVDFSESTYDWDNMIDSYHGEFNDAQATAVATLSYNCGVACNMQYGVNSSGAYIKDAADGLVKYFGYPSSVSCLARDDYSLSDWMNLVFTELSNGLPILYGGSDPNNGYGHAFVLDGYDNAGRVHVNWGWDGRDNGYYDISLLNPEMYEFSKGQEMVTGIDGRNRKELKKAVELSGAGTLSTLISDEEKYNVTDLTVNGPINSSDFLFIREMAGRDANDKRTRGRLKNIDLSGATFVAGGKAYLGKLVTTDKDLPERAFYNCQGLSEIKLPNNLKSVGDGAFAGAIGLDKVSFPVSEDANFVYTDSIVYSKDMKRCISAMPFYDGEMKIKDGVTEIAPYAVAGCTGISKIDIPASVEVIGTKAFAGDSYLSEIKIRAKKVPELTGVEVFNGILYPECKLYVPAGYKELYDNAEQWRMFNGSYYESITEFGSLIEAKNLSRQYGDPNPKLAYSIQGESIIGEPELSCDAVGDSPANQRYTITLKRGTVEGDDIELRDGYLVVTRAPLTLRANDASRHLGEANPEFTFTCEGLKNGETPEEVFTVQPSFECEATADSPEGAYPIIVYGGKTKNYSLKYEQGTLTVSGTSGIDGNTADAISVISGNGMIKVSSPYNVDIKVYGCAGNMVAAVENTHNTVFSGISAGLYIVKVGNRVLKINVD